jgi:hypothetical protein
MSKARDLSSGTNSRQLISTTALSTSSVTTSISVPSGYQELELHVYGFASPTSLDQLALNYNNDTGSNYFRTAGTSSSGSNSALPFIGSTNSGPGASNLASSYSANIRIYNHSVANKTNAFNSVWWEDSPGTLKGGVGTITWNSNAVVTSIQLKIIGNFGSISTTPAVSGTALLYGFI